MPRAAEQELEFDQARLRHRVAIQQQVEANPPATDAGGPTMIWQTIFWCWAAIDPLGGRDLISNGQTASEVEIPIRIRWRYGVTSAMRVKRPPMEGDVQGAAYIIRGIRNVQERNIWLDLSCVAIGPNQ